MTPRSPKPQPKTTTISRRLRNRADQNLSVQPPEIPELRSVRPRRAATLPTLRHDFPEFQTEKSHQSPPVWDHEDLTGDLQFSGISNPLAIGEQPPVGFLLAQDLEFPSYDPEQGSRTDSGPSSVTEPHAARDHQSRQTSTLESPVSPLPSVSGSLNFALSLSADPQQSQNPFLDLQEMSTLGFMMAPSQYGTHHYGSPPSYPQNYPPASQHGYAEHRSPTSGPYDSSYASSPALAHEQRRPEEQSVPPSYQTQPSSLTRSPYQQQQPLSSMRSNTTPLTSTTQGYAYPAAHGNVPSQALGSNASSYPPPHLYPPATYGISDYHPLPTMYPPSSTTPAAYPSYGSSPGIPQPPTGEVPSLSSSPSTQGSAMMPRILNSRPKPQCWEHGCNGRQFSTFSNLLRHQREKSGTASKSYCPRCGAEFTRTTARNGHMAHDKCKPRRPSESSH